jgi:Rod binding domain-containing protein
MGFDTPIVDLAQIANTTFASKVQRAASQLQAPMASDQVRRAAEEFEAVFIAQMMAPMFEGLETDEMFGGGPGEDLYRSILVEEYGKSIARAGGIGLSDAIQREIIRLQEASQQ